MKKLSLVLLTCAMTALATFGQTANEHGILINKRPLQDLGDQVYEKLSEKRLDLRKPFSVKITSKLTKEGKLDAKQTRVKVGEGSDPELAQIAVSAVESFGDSGYFNYLSQLGGTGDISFVLSQDVERFSSSITLGMDTEAKANSISSGLKTLLTMAGQKANLDEASMLLKNLYISAEGKTVRIAFSAPADVVATAVENGVKKSPTPKQ